MSDWPSPETLEAQKFARMCCDQGIELAAYTFEQASSYFWGFVAERYMLPAALKTYDLLVELGADEQHKLNFNDLDDNLFFIPVNDRSTSYCSNSEHAFVSVTTIKVFVHTSQNTDYLFVINECFDRKELHIRRIWREYKTYYDESARLDLASLTPHQWALTNLEWLSEFTDYPRDKMNQGPWRCDRPGLDTYRDLGFQIPTHLGEDPDIRFQKVSMYGDFRDRGYILSYDQQSESMQDFVKAERVNHRAEIVLQTLPWLVERCEEELKERNSPEIE